MVNVLLTMIITWWVQYRWRNVPHWTLFLFLWLLVAPLILYLVAALLFPTNQDDVVVTSWREHYYANNRKIFAWFGLTFVIDLVDTLFKGLTYFFARAALLRVDVAAHHALRNRRDNKIAPIPRLLRCLLSYLQSGNAWEQSAAADVAPVGEQRAEGGGGNDEARMTKLMLMLAIDQRPKARRQRAKRQHRQATGQRLKTGAAARWR